MDIQIRLAQSEEIESIMALYDSSRQHMRNNGNHAQWGNGYPSKELILQSIKNQKLYVCLAEHQIHGVFYWAVEKDPTYDVIHDGQWLNDDAYGVIHRLAGDGYIKGLGQKVILWCAAQHPNIRIDTHEMNRSMRGLLGALKFQYCGIIYVADGSARRAYQRVFNT